MIPYLFIGVFIGAFIYGFVQTFITKYASGGGIISVFIASIIGIPMYIRPETMLPIAEAFKRNVAWDSCCFDHWWCWCKYSRSCIIIETIQEKICNLIRYRHFSCSYFYRFDGEHRYLKEVR